MGVRADSAGWVTQSLHIPRKGLLDDGCLWNVLADPSVFPLKALRPLHPFAWIIHTESLGMASTCLLLATGASVTDPQEKPGLPGSGEVPWWTTLHVCRQPLSCVSSLVLMPFLVLLSVLLL